MFDYSTIVPMIEILLKHIGQSEESAKITLYRCTSALKASLNMVM